MQHFNSKILLPLKIKQFDEQEVFRFLLVDNSFIKTQMTINQVQDICQNLILKVLKASLAHSIKQRIKFQASH